MLRQAPAASHEAGSITADGSEMQASAASKAAMKATATDNLDDSIGLLEKYKTGNGSKLELRLKASSSGQQETKSTLDDKEKSSTKTETLMSAATVDAHYK